MPPGLKKNERQTEKGVLARKCPKVKPDTGLAQLTEKTGSESRSAPLPPASAGMTEQSIFRVVARPSYHFASHTGYGQIQDKNSRWPGRKKPDAVADR